MTDCCWRGEMDGARCGMKFGWMVMAVALAAGVQTAGAQKAGKPVVAVGSEDVAVRVDATELLATIEEVPANRARYLCTPVEGTNWRVAVPPAPICAVAIWWTLSQ